MSDINPSPTVGVNSLWQQHRRMPSGSVGNQNEWDGSGMAGARNGPGEKHYSCRE